MYSVDAYTEIILGIKSDQGWPQAGFTYNHTFVEGWQKNDLPKLEYLSKFLQYMYFNTSLKYEGAHGFSNHMKQSQYGVIEQKIILGQEIDFYELRKSFQ